MNKKILSFLKYLFVLGITFGLLYLAFRGVDVRKTIEEISGADLFWLSASVFVSLIAFVSRAYRWNLLIEPLGYRPKPKNTIYSLMVGYFANLAIPRLGEVTRCGSLSRAEKLPFNSLLGTVIVERLVDVICLLICMIITAVIEYDRLGNFLMDTVLTPVSRKITPVFISIAIVSIAVLVWVIIWFAKKNNVTKSESKIINLVKGLIEGLRSIGQLKRPVAFLMHTLLIWIMYFFMAYLAFFSLPATSGLSWSAGMFILVVGGLGMSAPVQGGIGAYHLLVSQGLMLYGLNQQDGLAFATLLHTSQMFIVILLGSISLLLLFLESKNRSNDISGENQI